MQAAERIPVNGHQWTLSSSGSSPYVSRRLKVFVHLESHAVLFALCPIFLALLLFCFHFSFYSHTRFLEAWPQCVDLCMWVGVHVKLKLSSDRQLCSLYRRWRDGGDGQPDGGLAVWSSLPWPQETNPTQWQGLYLHILLLYISHFPQMNSSPTNHDFVIIYSSSCLANWMVFLAWNTNGDVLKYVLVPAVVVIFNGSTKNVHLSLLASKRTQKHHKVAPVSVCSSNKPVVWLQ